MKKLFSRACPLSKPNTPEYPKLMISKSHHAIYLMTSQSTGTKLTIGDNGSFISHGIGNTGLI